ncbi:g9232 [Coccomyxa elongata]
MSGKAGLLPVVERSKEQRSQRSSAATVLLWNGIALVLFGGLSFCFPHVIEGYHPHRKGEEEILASIQWGGGLLVGIGALYSLAGGLNLQGYMHGLLIHRFTAIPLLYFCYHFGKIYWVEFVAYVIMDPPMALATYLLHRKDVARMTSKRK